jgi:hypothetical protein
MNRFAFVLVLALAQAAGAAPADPKKAKALAEMVIPRATYEQMVAQMTQQMLASLPPPPPDAPKDFGERIKAAITDVLPYEQEIQVTSEILVKYYTDEEIGELRKFYESPVGKKALTIMPQVMGDVTKRVMTLMQQKMPAALEKHGLGPKTAPAKK